MESPILLKMKSIFSQQEKSTSHPAKLNPAEKENIEKYHNSVIRLKALRLAMSKCGNVSNISSSVNHENNLILSFKKERKEVKFEFISEEKTKVELFDSKGNSVNLYIMKDGVPENKDAINGTFSWLSHIQL